MPQEARPGARSVELPGELIFGPFSFDPVNRLLCSNGIELPLPPRVLGVLDHLLQHPGRIVSRQDLIDTVWKDAFVTDTSLAEAVSFLRQTLGDDAQAPQYIQTVHRRGYRFVASIERGAGPQPQERSGDAAGGPAPEPVSPSLLWQLVPWSITALLAITTGTALWLLLSRHDPEVRNVTRFSVELPEGTHLDPYRPALALAPDGDDIAFVACGKDGCRIFLRSLGSRRPRPLPGTAGGSLPFFSPDGRWVGFFAEGKLKKVAVEGGLPAVLSDASQPFGAAWGIDGRIVFAASFAGGLQAVSERGGQPAPLTVPDTKAGEFRHCWPERLNDGRSILFTIADAPFGGTGRAASAR